MLVDHWLILGHFMGHDAAVKNANSPAEAI